MDRENRKKIIQKIEERFNQELERQGIELPDLTEDEISKIVEKITADVLKIANKRKSESPYKKKISRDAKTEFKARIIKGESQEEIRQGLEAKLSPTQINELIKEYEILGMLVQAMPYDEVAKRVIKRIDGEAEADFEKRYSRQKTYCSQIVMREQIGDLIKDKKSEIERLLRQGISQEEILQNRELNVCREAVSYIQAKIEREQEKEDKEQQQKQCKTRKEKQEKQHQMSKQTKRKIRDFLLTGKTIEEIHAMPEFSIYGQEELERIQQQEELRILAIQLVDLTDIAEQLGIKRQSVYINCNNYYLQDDKNILQIRKEKEQQIIQRLEAGETVDEISRDRNLFVSQDAVAKLKQELEKKQAPQKKEPKKELNEKAQDIFELYAQGKTPEEIQKMEQYAMFSIEDLEQIQEKNKIRLLYLQLVNTGEIAEIAGVKLASIYQNVKNAHIGGKSLKDIREEKKEQVIQRLQAGETVEVILEDKNLFVSQDAVIALKQELEKKQSKPKKQTKRELKEKMQDIFELYAQGKTPEEVQKMEQYAMLSIEDLRQIQEKNKIRLQYLQLVDNTEIIRQTGIKLTSIYQNLNNANIQGRSIQDIAREKRELILNRLRRGETSDMILADKTIFVCKEAVLKLEKRVKPAKPRNTAKSDKPKEDERKKETDTSEYKLRGFEKAVAGADSLYDKKRRIAHFNMRKMKSKYERLWKNISAEEIQSEEKKSQSPEDSKKIQTAISKMQQKLADLEKENIGKFDRAGLIREILKEGNNILKYEFTFEQAEAYQQVFSAKGIEDFRNNTSNSDYRSAIGKMIRNANRKLAMAIQEIARETDDLDILEDLRKKLPRAKMQDDIGIDSVRILLSNKIQKLRTDLTIWKMKNEVLPEMHEIIQQVANGEIDFARANQTISELAKEKVESKPTTRFSLTSEQERKQFLMQIRSVLTERGEEYPIQDSEKTMHILQELLGDDKIFNLRTIVKNQLGRKEYEAAKQTCSMLKVKDLDDSSASQLQSLRREVRGVEVGEMILKAIQTDCSIEEETRIWELLEEGIRLKNVPFQTISLGKTQDGTKNIMLRDVWPGNLRDIQR